MESVPLAVTPTVTRWPSSENRLSSCSVVPFWSCVLTFQREWKSVRKDDTKDKMIDVQYPFTLLDGRVGSAFCSPPNGWKGYWSVTVSETIEFLIKWQASVMVFVIELDRPIQWVQTGTYHAGPIPHLTLFYIWTRLHLDEHASFPQDTSNPFKLSIEPVTLKQKKCKH